jgi:hypothetical protein
MGPGAETAGGGRRAGGGAGGAAVRRLFALGLLLGAACASSRYRVERRQLACDDANRHAHATLVRLGYEITRFDPAAPRVRGVVAGRRKVPEGVRHGQVRIVCGETVILQPVEGAWFLPNFDFSRDVFYGLVTVIDRPPSPPAAEAVAPGLRVALHPLERFEARKELGVDVEALGLLAVRAAIANRTPRVYALDAERIVLIDAAGERVAPLGPAAIAARVRAQVQAAAPGTAPAVDAAAVARTLGERRLAGGRLAAGELRGGFLFFPAGSYRSARVTLVDEETGEAEGTVVGF